jgi:Putative transposase DNA-binding domain.
MFEYVTYKAESEGLVLKQINTAHTSQRCSKCECGFTHKENCSHTNGQDDRGYDVHADYNAGRIST